MRLKKLLLTISAVIIFGLLVWLTYIQNENITELRSQGKDYNVGANTVQNGKDGKSTYDIAVDQGFEGSKTDWLLSLAVEPIKGADGEPGLSAYEIAQNYGFNGTPLEWLDSLSVKGDKGDSATTEQLIEAYAIYCQDGSCQGIPGANGVNGEDGVNGNDGKDGADGISPPHVFWSCVLRSVETTPAVFVTKQFESWKYTDETDSAYRDQYEIPDTQPCVNPIDLRI